MISMGRWSGSSEILYPLVYSVVFLIVGDHIHEASAASNLALLSGTLRTFQAHACDSKELRIECPPETVISINFAHYGRVSQEHICAPESNPHGNLLNGWNSGNTTCHAPQALKVIEEKCREQRICRLLTLPETFGNDPCPGVQKFAEVAYKCRPGTRNVRTLHRDYSLDVLMHNLDILGSQETRWTENSDENEMDMFYSQLQDILTSLKKGDISLVLGDFNAKVGTDSDLWAGVLGPFGIGGSNGNGGTSPTVEFRNRVICEGERFLLRCRRSEQKILIYSASFGSTHYEAVECPQKKEGKSEDCQSSYATETVMSSCHGQQKCSLAADVQTFGNPGCSPSTRKHLKVIFTCVPQQVLRILPPASNEYNGESQEHPVRVYTTSYPGWAGNRDFTIPPHLVPESTKRPAGNVNSTYKSEMQSDEISGDVSSDENCTKNQRVIRFITEWISAYKFMSDNKEKLILYVVASVGIGLLLFFLMLAGRLFHLRARARRRAKFSNSPRCEGEFLDDDSDLEQTERDERPPSRHSSRISVRRQDSDVQTRTPLTQGDTHNHYYS